MIVAQYLCFGASMMLRRALAILLVIGFSSAAHAQTGNEFLAQCDDSKGAVEGMKCLSYVDGITDGFDIAILIDNGVQKQWTIPQGVTLGQLRDIIVGYVKAHPESRHLSMTLLAWNALNNAFKK